MRTWEITYKHTGFEKGFRKTKEQGINKNDAIRKFNDFFPEGQFDIVEVVEAKKTFEETVRELGKQFPNDKEFGTEVRKLLW